MALRIFLGFRVDDRRGNDAALPVQAEELAVISCWLLVSGGWNCRVGFNPPKITEVASYKYQVTSYKLQVASYKLQVSSYKYQVTSIKYQVSSIKLQGKANLRLAMRSEPQIKADKCRCRR